MNKRTIITLIAAAITMAAAAQVKVVGDTCSLGTVTFGTVAHAVFTVRNYGTSPVTVRPVNAGCDCRIVEYPMRALRPGESAAVRVDYRARLLGTFTRSVAIAAEGSARPLYLTLHGRVDDGLSDFTGDYKFRLNGFKIDKNNIEFDEVRRGDRLTQHIFIYNDSTVIAEPQLMHLPPYLTASVEPARLAPGHGGVITVSLDSRKIHDFGLNQTAVYLGSYAGDRVSDDKEITLSAVLLPDVDRTPASIAPHMALSATELNLGRFGKKSKLHGVIKITNTGYSTLEIRSLQLFTVGLQLDLSKTKIEPGGSASLKITALKPAVFRARSKPRVLMITNSPTEPKAVVKVNVSY